MSQFDETTEKKAVFHDPFGGSGAFKEGRNSAKESLEILARALSTISKPHDTASITSLLIVAMDAIRQVKVRGDWPLKEDS